MTTNLVATRVLTNFTATLYQSVLTGASDGKVYVNEDDSTSDFLENKLVAGAGITLNVQDDLGVKTIEIVSEGAAAAVTSVNTRTGDVVLTKSDVGLSNVVNLNTSTTTNITDATNKRFITDAQKTILQNTSGVNTGDQNLTGLVPKTTTVNGHALTGNVTVTKGDVSLGNVDNTSDANKPVSTAQQTALNLKVDKTTTVNGHALSANVTVSKTDVGLGNVQNLDQTNPANITQDSTHRFVSDTEKSTWNAKQNALGFTPENVANKSTNTSLGTSDTLYPSQKAVKAYADTKLAPNSPITGATKTKVTYDINGLVTAGTDATTADIADSTNKRYVSDAQLTVLGNTSGTNTGDQDLSGYQTTAGMSTAVPANETDPVFTASQAFNIDATDITNLGNLSGTNTGDQDLSSYALTANVHNVPAGGLTGCVLSKIDDTDYNTEWTAPGSGGATAFTDLTDVPNDYTGFNGCLVAVNPGATGLEFVPNSSANYWDKYDCVADGVFYVTPLDFVDETNYDRSVRVSRCSNDVGFELCHETYNTLTKIMNDSICKGQFRVFDSYYCGTCSPDTTCVNFWARQDISIIGDNPVQCGDVLTYNAFNCTWEPKPASGGVANVTGNDSIYTASDGAGGVCVYLVNDMSSPMPNMLYGTDGMSNRGFYNRYQWTCATDACVYCLGCLATLGLGTYCTTQLCSVSDMNGKYGLEILDACWSVPSCLYPGYHCDGTCANAGDVLTRDGFGNYYAAPAGGSGSNYWDIFDCTYTSTFYVTPLDYCDGMNWRDRSVRVSKCCDNVFFELYNEVNCALTTIGQESCKGLFEMYDSCFYMTCSCPTVNVNFWSRDDYMSVGDCTRQDGDVLAWNCCTNTWRAAPSSNFWDAYDCTMSNIYYLTPKCYCDGMSWYDRDIRIINAQGCGVSYEMYHTGTCRLLCLGQDSNCCSPFKTCNDYYCSTSTCQEVLVNFWAKADGMSAGDCPRVDGDVLAWNCCTNTWEPKTLSGGAGTSSGNSCSIQLADGSNGFWDAGCCNGNNYFEYACNSLNLLGCDMGYFNQRLKIYDTYSDRYAWTFNSGDTCSGTCGAGFDFVVGDLSDSTFRMGNCCGNFDFKVNQWRQIFTNIYSQTAEWGLSNCGAFFGVSDCCAPYINFGCGSCCRVDIFNGTYGDQITWQDYQTGLSGSNCDLILSITNGCSYGYTQIDFSGLGLGGVLNSNLCCSLKLATNNCVFLDGSYGLTQTLGLWNLAGDICVGGNSTYTGIIDLTTATSISVVCGLITGIM